VPPRGAPAPATDMGSFKGQLQAESAESGLSGVV
jgi:hypothetical protein